MQTKKQLQGLVGISNMPQTNVYSGELFLAQVPSRNSQDIPVNRNEMRSLRVLQLKHVPIFQQLCIEEVLFYKSASNWWVEAYAS